MPAAAGQRARDVGYYQAALTAERSSDQVGNNGVIDIAVAAFRIVAQITGYYIGDQTERFFVLAAADQGVLADE